jgi:hypothetical protein
MIRATSATAWSGLFAPAPIMWVVSSLLSLVITHYLDAPSRSPWRTGSGMEVLSFGCLRINRCGLTPSSVAATGGTCSIEFNEDLVRGQDFEFNVRLHRAGLRTLLVPNVRSTYFARSKPLDFVKHNWANGVWAILPFRYSDVVPVSFRHLVPMLFVGFLIGTALLGIWFHPLAFASLFVFGCYALTTLAVSASIAIEQRDARLLAVMPIVFWSLHLTYGLGSLWAGIRSIDALWRHATPMAPRNASSG